MGCSVWQGLAVSECGSCKLVPGGAGSWELELGPRSWEVVAGSRKVLGGSREAGTRVLQEGKRQQAASSKQEEGQGVGSRDELGAGDKELGSGSGLTWRGLP